MDTQTKSLRLLMMIALAMILAACTAARPSALVLQPNAVPVPQRVVEVLAVTNRVPSMDGGFGALRATRLSYESYRISVPRILPSTEINYAENGGSPEKHFLVLSRTALSETKFIAAVRTKASSGQSAGLYVHGYNQTYQEALFRLAQVSADSGSRGPSVLFSWPSEASVFGYMADREASLASRNDLAQIVRAMVGNTGVKQLVVAGHSMGAFLVMETVRQLALGGDKTTLDKLGIVLAAPDIDPDVFSTQLATIGQREPPILVMVSRNDRALAISGQLSGNRPRVGALDVTNPLVQSAVQASGVFVVDITSVPSGDAFQHDGFASMPRIAAQLSMAEDGGIPLPTQAGLLIVDTARTTMNAPAWLD